MLSTSGHSLSVTFSTRRFPQRRQLDHDVGHAGRHKVNYSWKTPAIGGTQGVIPTQSPPTRVNIATRADGDDRRLYKPNPTLRQLWWAKLVCWAHPSW